MGSFGYDCSLVSCHAVVVVVGHSLVLCCHAGVDILSHESDQYLYGVFDLGGVGNKLVVGNLLQVPLVVDVPSHDHWQEFSHSDVVMDGDCFYHQA